MLNVAQVVQHMTQSKLRAVVTATAMLLMEVVDHLGILIFASTKGRQVANMAKRPEGDMMEVTKGTTQRMAAMTARVNIITKRGNRMLTPIPAVSALRTMIVPSRTVGGANQGRPPVCLRALPSLP